MEIRRIGLCILLILCTGLSQVDTATLTASINPRPAVKGATGGHIVRCDFSVAAGDTFQFMNLYLTGVPTKQLIAVIFTNGGSPLWDENAPQDLQQRGTLGGSKQQGVLSLAINDTLCSDLDQSYECYLRWSTASSAQSSIQTATVALEAPPKAPEVMQVSPNSDNVTEFTEMTFTCSGNVGRPAGTFQWFTIADTTVNVTDKATQGNALAETSPGETCTFNRTSVLTLNVTRIGQGKRLVVRCRVNHPTQGNSNPEACQDPDVDYCRMSQQFDIQYPVRVGVSSDAMTGEEEKDISITCTTQGNPLPYRIKWHREGDENNTLSTENSLTLRNLTLSDTGNYTCTAYNMVEGSTRQDSVTVLVTVERTTTPPPTTTTSTSTTSSPSDKPGTQPSTAGGGDSDTVIIIVVVVVVLVVIVAVVVIVFFIRRRRARKEVEEPPEKPFNNNAGINTMAMRPDLVSNDKSYPGVNNSNGYKNEDGLTYAELQFDNKPRSRRPLAIDDSHTDYSDVSMPQV